MAGLLPILLIGGAVAGLAAGGNKPDLPDIPEPVAIPEAPKVPELVPPAPEDILASTADRREVSRSRSVRQRIAANSLTNPEDEVKLVDVKNLLGS